jgi:hypothetical protein
VREIGAKIFSPKRIYTRGNGFGKWKEKIIEILFKKIAFYEGSLQGTLVRISSLFSKACDQTCVSSIWWVKREDKEEKTGVLNWAKSLL